MGPVIEAAWFVYAGPFLQGHAEYYNSVKYGEPRVTASGDSVLVGLRGQNLERLGPLEKRQTP